MSNKSQAFPIEPLYENVLIEPIEMEEKLPKGLVGLPPKDGEKPLIGIIRGISTKKWTEKGVEYTPKFPFNVGDKVLYRKWSMSEMKYEGSELVVVRQQDVAAIINF
jgi:chaperonin GroES